MCIKIVPSNRPPNFVYALLQLLKKEYLLLAYIFYTIQTKYLPMYWNDSIGRIQILGKT
jgi:hypothetical protein